MFKAARWRSEKNRAKAVFKLQFKATQVTQSGSQPLMVVLVPADIGRPTARTGKAAAAADGTCSWANPVYEAVKLVRNPTTGKMDEKVYRFILSPTGSGKAGFLGEVTMNLADYAEVFEAASVSLPLKPSSTGTILHVSIQRIEGDGKGREGDEVGEVMIKQQRKILPSQLKKWNIEDSIQSSRGINSIKFIKDGSHITQSRSKFVSSRDIPKDTDFDGSILKSYSFDAISLSDSDSSSNIYTPRDNGVKHQSFQRTSTTFLAPLTNITKKLVLNSGDWSGTPAPDENADALTSTSGDAGLDEKPCDSLDIIEKLRSDVVILTRKVEVSDLEMQNLRKQISRETSRGQDLLRELSSLKEERDALRRDCEELRLSEKRTKIDGRISTRLQHDGDDSFSLLEDIKQELDHERNQNVHLRLQLRMMQQSNSESIFPMKDLAGLLEPKNKETICMKCGNIVLEMETCKLGNEISLLPKSDCSYEEQCALSAQVDECYDVKTDYSQQNSIVDIDDEIDFYRQDNEELEIQMEQLALDYEILKQENHDISTKLQQMQVREQLRTQYECSAHVAIINDLESRVECLEKELQKQAEAFETNIEILTCSKVEQEKRAILAEEALRNAKWNICNIVERLQENFRSLSAQMAFTLKENEKIVKQVLRQAAELQLQKNIVEEMLEKSKRDLVSMQDQYRMKFKQLIGLIDFKSKEVDRLLLDLKDKQREIENYKLAEEERQKISLEEMHLLQAEIKKLKSDRSILSEQNKEEEKLLLYMEPLRTSSKECEVSLVKGHLEIDLLKKEIAVLKEENQLLKENDDVRHEDDEKDTVMTELKSKAEYLGPQYSGLKLVLYENEFDKQRPRRSLIDLSGGILEELTTSTGEDGLYDGDTTTSNVKRPPQKVS